MEDFRRLQLHLELQPGLHKRDTKPRTGTDGKPFQLFLDLEEKAAQLNHDLQKTAERVTRDLDRKANWLNCDLENTVTRVYCHLQDKAAWVNVELQEVVSRLGNNLSERSDQVTSEMEEQLRRIKLNMREKFARVSRNLEEIAVRVNHDLEEKAAKVIPGLSPSVLHLDSQPQPNVTTVVIHSPSPTHSTTALREPSSQVMEPKSKEEVEATSPPGKPPLKPAEDDILHKKALDDTGPTIASPQKKCISIESFELCKVLGKGNFGKVLLAKLKETGEFFAIKVLKKERVISFSNIDYAMAERRVLALACDCPYLLHLYSSFQTKEHLFYVMECLKGGDLMFNLQQTGPFDLSRATFYAAEIICGLQFLHSRGIIHRDLKLENLMLDKDGHIRIIDFGLCKDNMSEGKLASNFCGTAHYMAPEIINGWKYSYPVDWWSFGVVVFTMLNGVLPFQGRNELELFKSIRKTTPQHQLWVTAEARDLMEKLFERDPYDRIGFVGNIRAHPFFENIDWPALERREVKPPFRPKVKHSADFSNLRWDLPNERLRFSKSNKNVIDSVDPAVFAGFSFTNPNWRCS
ncbi:protein kinase C delta type-like [Megalops cyprinoides]|uniref:protein kinase C delta type-like n=1 Tax=Megalops cyprinoides TaxID=118141 RepID=UPI001864B72C|nr:protein kinase C delta type-like [Megalops cyprinoides]